MVSTGSIPLPHAAFFIGDTVPFSLQIETDEQGQPWTAQHWKGAYVYCDIEPPVLPHGHKPFPKRITLNFYSGAYAPQEAIATTDTGGAYWLFESTPDTPAGIYRYIVRLKFAIGGNGAHRMHTLARGTFSLSKRP